MIETESSHITKIDEETIKIIFKANARLSMKEYDHFFPKYKKVLGNENIEKIKFLIIIQEGFKMEKQFMMFFKKFYKTAYKKAEAYMIMDPTTKMFFKVGVKMVNQKFPIKLFDKEEEALSWLKSLK